MMQQEKRDLRLVLRARLRALSTEKKQSAGEEIARHLHELVSGKLVAAFASTADEIDTRPLDSLLPARLLPRIEGNDLVFHLVEGPSHALPRDRFGIPTPRADSVQVALRECEVILVPGLGFDDEGGRLGYGKGYYDRALAAVDRSRIMGVFLDEQRVAKVPMTSSDVRLPRFCTPERGIVVVDK